MQILHIINLSADNSHLNLSVESHYKLWFAKTRMSSAFVEITDLPTFDNNNNNNKMW